MERRDVLFGAGALALAAVARPAVGQEMQGMAGMHHEMGTKHQSLIDAATHCSTLAELCLSHCLMAIAMGEKTLLDCAAKSRELAVVCNGLASLAAQNAPELALYAKMTAQVCDICEAECKKFPQHPPCKACGEACAACAAECRKVT